MKSWFHSSLTEPSRPECFTGKRLRSKPQWIEDTKDYMMTHFSDPITLDDLASVVNMSKFNLCRQFHRHQGMPPLKWLWRFRALLAREVLNLPLNWDIQEVAFSCGFTSSAHFSRAFKDNFGFTPSDYRSLATSGSFDIPAGEFDGRHELLNLAKTILMRPQGPTPPGSDAS